jgi:hypothetical protein
MNGFSSRSSVFKKRHSFAINCDRSKSAGWLTHSVEREIEREKDFLYDVTSMLLFSPLFMLIHDSQRQLRVSNFSVERGRHDSHFKLPSSKEKEPWLLKERS